MSDSTVKNTSCLAITTEKRAQQKPGGCVGIFFQLFEWKKKLAKKKLFSKKLLPPAHAKKLGGDEKMSNSKLNLIANENSGGFPTVKKGGSCGLDLVERKSETRVPGLVARLMGLDYMPASRRDKSKKDLHSDSCGDREKELKGNFELDRHGMDLETGTVKNDSRPKTYETQAVTRFGAEALQIKSVLSRARKHNHSHHHHHHPKLPTPLKGPRTSSGKSASRSARLIGAATKILEPGLQARSRVKGSITYPTSVYPPRTDIGTNCEGTRSEVIQYQSDYEPGTAKPLIGQTSCKNCGNLLDVVVECKPDLGEHPEVPSPIVSDVTTSTSAISAPKKGKLFAPSHDQERDVVLPRSQVNLASLVTEKEGKNSVQHSSNERTTKGMTLLRQDLAPWNPSSQSFSTPEGSASSSTLKHRAQTQELMLIGERIPSGSTMSRTQVKRVSSSASTVNGTKDFVALNKGLSGQMRMRSSTKLDTSKFDLEKKPCYKQNKPLSDIRTSERKRGTPSATQAEVTASVNSVSVKQRNHRSDPLGGKRRDFVSSSSLNSSNVKSKQCGQGKTVKVNDNKINGVVSYSFHSSLKQKMGMPAEKEGISNGNERSTCFQRPSRLRVDALGAFIEQKLKELTSHEDALAAGALPQKSTAEILQELISGISSQHLICQDVHFFNENAGFHDGAKQERLSGISCSRNHHLSPGSVLEASFSSSSLDESSGHSFHPDSISTSYSCDQLEQLERDPELFDSATSFNKGRVVCEILTDLVDQIPGAIQSLYPSAASLTTGKLAHMKDVILIVELVLGIDTDYSGDEVPPLLIYRFLFNELDAVVSDPMWTDFNVLLGCCEDSRERQELKGFVFDCVIEYLESSCCQCFNCGLKAWWRKKLPQCLRAEMLAQEVKMEIKKWDSMAGMVPDDIIEWEMSHSLGKWVDFDIEAFETGVDIGGNIFQILVDEVVDELVGFKHGDHATSHQRNF